MRLSRLLPPAALTLAAALAACADAPFGPASSATAPAVAPRLSTTGAIDTIITVFDYNPAGSLTQTFGNVHKLRMPAGAVCDPATSGYGAGTWESACTPLSGKITFTAKTWKDAAGHPRVAFSPDVRFVPATVVTLELLDKVVAAGQVPNVLWCSAAMTGCVDEGAGDPQVATTYDAKTGYAKRRVKHFSGYTMSVGRTDDGGY